MHVNHAEMTRFLKAEIASAIHADINEIDEDVNFLKLGISSLQALKMINRIKQKLAIEINPVALLEYKTISAFSGYLVESLAQKN